jgi:predicted RNA-binding Zn-ribbon protein involved in translation (DUF1610 family)
MPRDPHAEYRCPKCGAQAALIIPEAIPRATDVVLKCVDCAHISRIPRERLQGAGGPLDSKPTRD